jgi:biopolymer transport protein ExbD
MARRHSADGVELNVTAMLDMAFQLLAFFILTFKPGPLEPAVSLHIPPARPVAPSTGADLGVIDMATFQPAGIDTLRIGLFSASGSLDRMTINGFPAETFDGLRNTMRRILADPASPVRQVVVQASEGLRYDEVMKVIGICSEEKLPKTGEHVRLSLVATADGSEAR